MKNIEEKLAKVEADKKELEKAIKLVKDEEARLLALKEEEEKKEEYKMFHEFTPTAQNVSVIVQLVINESDDLLKQKVVTSDTKWLDSFAYEEGRGFSFGEWTIKNHVRYGEEKETGKNTISLLK